MKMPWKFSCPVPGRAEQEPQEGRSSLVAPLLPAAHGVGPWGGVQGPAAGACLEPAVARVFDEVCMGLG